MLQTTAEILSSGNSGAGRAVTTSLATCQRPSSRTSPVPQCDIDRENDRKSSCNRLWQMGINRGRLACEFLFPDAELEQCISKGGASFLRRSPQQDSSSYGHRNRWFHILLTLVLREGRRSWRVLKGSRFSGRRPSEGRGRCNEVVLRKRWGKSRASDLCGTANLSCVAEKAGLPTLSVKEVDHV